MCASSVSIRVFPYEICLKFAGTQSSESTDGAGTAGEDFRGEPLRQGPARSRSPGSASPQASFQFKLSEKEAKRFLAIRTGCATSRAGKYDLARSEFSGLPLEVLRGYTLLRKRAKLLVVGRNCHSQKLVQPTRIGIRKSADGFYPKSFKGGAARLKKGNWR